MATLELIRESMDFSVLVVYFNDVITLFDMAIEELSLIVPTKAAFSLMATPIIREIVQIQMKIYSNVNYPAIFMLMFMIWLSHVVFTEADKYSKNNSLSGQTFFMYKETEVNENIVQCIKSVGDYSPPWWYNAHIGTTLSLGHYPNLDLERQVYTNEHSNVAVDWYPSMLNVNENQSKPIKICVFLPGLGLSSRSKFAQKFLEVMSKGEYVCAVVNARGTELPLKSAKLWHPGHYHDAKSVLNFIRSHYPLAQVFLVGFSAGSNIIHKLVLNYEKKHGFIRAAVAVCITSDYASNRKRLEETLQGKIYSALLTLGHKNTLLRNDHIHSLIDPSTLSKLLSCKFVSEYDAIASSLYNFQNESEYLEALSSSFADHRINIPYLAIQPRDDPLHCGFTRENINIHEFSENPNTIYMEPKYGNHFGFYEGSLFGAFSNTTSYTYPAKVALEFFRAVIEQQ